MVPRRNLRQYFKEIILHKELEDFSTVDSMVHISLRASSKAAMPLVIADGSGKTAYVTKGTLNTSSLKVQESKSLETRTLILYKREPGRMGSFSKAQFIMKASKFATSSSE